MLWKGKYLGTLALGVTPNKALASAALTREVTIAVFISIWVLVILELYSMHSQLLDL